MICCGNKTKAKWMSELDVIAKTVIGSLFVVCNTFICVQLKIHQSQPNIFTLF